MSTQIRKDAAYKAKMQKRRVATLSWLNILGVGFLSLIILVAGKLVLNV